MKKILNVAALILPIFLGGLLESPVSAISTPLPEVKISLPAASFEFEDLDVRDELNRRVTSTEKRAELRTLFVSRLNNLLMAGLTPAKSRVAAILLAQWDPSDGWFKALAGFWGQKVVAVLQNKIWEWLKPAGFVIQTVPPVGEAQGWSWTAESPLKDLLSIFVATTVIRR